MSATIPDVQKNGHWCKTLYINKEHCHTESGVKWGNINNRCKNHPAYNGCINRFKDFDSFVEWHRKQVGYGKGWHLDKDIIVRGNKFYDEDTCVLVPQEINKLLLTRKNCRGQFPIGVVSVGSRFRSVLQSNLNTSSHLGYFDTPEDAFAAYKVAKESLVKRVAEMWKTEIDTRVYDALVSYSVKITD